MYTIKLDENDLLEFQLFRASKSKRIKRKRITTWLFLTISTFILAYLFMATGNNTVRNYFIVLGVVSLFFFPYYQRWRYRKHYLKHVRENLHNQFLKEAHIKFDAEYLVTYDDKNESKIDIAEIDIINETSEHIFVKTKPGQSLIIPKRFIDVEKFINGLSRITSNAGIVWKRDLSWKWR